MTTKKFIIPFKTKPQENIATIGKDGMGTLEVPQYKMLTTSEKAAIESADLWTIEVKDRETAKLAKEIYDAELAKSGERTGIGYLHNYSFSDYDRIIREMQNGYTMPTVPTDCTDEEAFLADDFKAYEKRNFDSRNVVSSYLGKIGELSAQIAREDDRRYEVYARVIANNRLVGLEEITYSELSDTLKNPDLTLRLGLFGIYEEQGRTYHENLIGASDEKEEKTQATAPKTQDEVLKP